MAKKTGNEISKERKMTTSIGKSKNSKYNKKRHRKNGKKVYRGQGR